MEGISFLRNQERFRPVPGMKEDRYRFGRIILAAAAAVVLERIFP